MRKCKNQKDRSNTQVCHYETYDHLSEIDTPAASLFPASGKNYTRPGAKDF